MKYLPGVFEEQVRSWGWSQPQIIAYCALNYLNIVIYCLLILLALHNIWVIILKQKEYKNLPIFAFYAYTLIAISLRPIFLIWVWTYNPYVANSDWIQQAAKFCVGLVQDWITLELAVRIHNARGVTDISETAKRKLRKIRSILFAVTTFLFAAFSVYVVVTAHLAGNEGFAFFIVECTITYTIGYLFLLQVIVMFGLVIWLFVETQRAVDRELAAWPVGKV